MPSRQKQTKSERITTEGYTAESKQNQTQKPGRQVSKTTRGAQTVETGADDVGATIQFTIPLNGSC